MKFKKQKLEVLKKVEEKVNTMIKSCDVQKNVNMTMKSGSKCLRFFIMEAKDKHLGADKYDSNLVTAIVIGYGTYNREEHNRQKERKLVKTLRRLGLESQKRSIENSESTKGNGYFEACSQENWEILSSVCFACCCHSSRQNL